jgi:4-coumarate--CoA ligase
VQIGGINVFPARVADILHRHPKVRDCAVRMMRPEEGTRLKAFVVPSDEAASGHDLTQELRQWLATQLEMVSMPKSFSFGPILPRTSSGKLVDWDIAGRVNQRHEKAQECNQKSR